LKALECGKSPGKGEVPPGDSARSKGVILLGVTLLALIDLSEALPSESSLPLGGVTNKLPSLAPCFYWSISWTIFL